MDLHDDVLTFTPPADVTAAAVDEATRTVTGVIVPYGVIGLTSVGPLIVNAGAVEWPEDLSRVKLFSDHFGPVVGYMTALEDTAEAAAGTFAIANTPAGDLYIAEARDHVRDGFSIELVGASFDPADETTVTAASCRGVAGVPIPAFDDARITEVAASRLRPTTEVDHMETIDAQAVNTAQIPPDVAASQPDNTPATVPAGLRTGTARRPLDDFTSMDDVYAAMAQVARGSATPDVMAALADLTQSAVGVDVEQPAWVGHLWSGVEYTRKIVPLFGAPNPLRSFKVNGWKWTTKPAMAAYAGDKAALTSNAAATDPATATASRLAGGHDHDRRFVDFDVPGYWESYYAAMAESYARLTDAAALAAALAGATAVANAYTDADFLSAIATGVAAIDDSDNAKDTFVIANKAQLIPWVLGTTNDDLPAFLSLLGVSPERIVTHSGMTSGKVLVGTAPAMNYYELSGTPIRVEAVDILKAGVDTGLYGYYATMVNDATGLQLVTIDNP